MQTPEERIADLEADLEALKIVMGHLIEVLRDQGSVDPCALLRVLRQRGENTDTSSCTWSYVDGWIDELRYHYCGETPDAVDNGAGSDSEPLRMRR
jgi:hypothetical protein